MNYEKAIRNSSSLDEIFEIVKEIGREAIGVERLDIRILLTDLGYSYNGFIGAFYHYPTNTITLNLSPLREIAEKYPKLIKYYLFHLLLHEYVHALGVSKELRTRKIVYLISKEYFGENHILTQLSLDMGKVLLQLERENSISNYRKDFFEEIDEIFSEIFDNISGMMSSSWAEIDFSFDFDY